MRVTLTVTMSSGDTLEVATTPLAWMRWERRTGRSASDLAERQSITDLVLLAYEAARVSGIVVPSDPEKWAADIVEVGTVAETVPPTVPVPSVGSSESSPS